MSLPSVTTLLTCVGEGSGPRPPLGLETFQSLCPSAFSLFFLHKGVQQRYLVLQKMKGEKV